MAVDDTTEPDPKAPPPPPRAAFALGSRVRGRVSRAPLDERYRMLETLGRGGMGEVIAAHDDVLGRDVAIKRMLDVDRPHATMRFLREARIQSMLDHPAIPPVHELAQDSQGRPYFVMKRLTGTTLAKILEDQSRGLAQQYPLEKLLNAFADVCLAIELAHTRGIIHRDLKPANIMLGDFGEVFVLDWGVAKVINANAPALTKLVEVAPISTQAGVVIGTEGYMPPEQKLGLDLDARVDVYALGCVLYEIVTGRRFDPRVRASEKAPERVIAPELDELCAAATASERSTRLASARVLGARVQHYLNGDRDVAMRRRLARQTLSRAMTVAKTPTEEAQSVAMREAGRALALDPTSTEAADLVSRLMLEPPRTMPTDVAESLARAERTASIKHTRVASLAYLMYAAFIPYMVWMGIRQWWAIGAFAAILTFLLAAAWLRVRYPDRLAFAIATVVGNAGMIALLGRMFSPYFIATGVATLTISSVLSGPKFRRRPLLVTMIACILLATVGSGLLELAGVLDATITFSGDALAINTGVIDLHATGAHLGLAIYALGLILGAALITRELGRANDDSQRRLHLQAWRLRQLVPDPSVSSAEQRQHGGRC
jgi:eukaryotic-like serine/threonine-protein kinase